MAQKHHHADDGCKVCAEEPPADLLAACRAAGLRRTHLLRRVLEVLQSQPAAPVSIRELLAARGVRGVCDPATLYRLLQRLEEKGIVRRIGLHERAAHFTLRRGHHHDYVVCRQCGEVELLDMACPAEKLEHAVGRRTGFTDVDHELQFYGVCPKCAKTGKN